MASYRGLHVFVHDVRNCKSREAEQARVDKELANIRNNFTGKSLNAYNRKKYMWKLVYMHMMGYEIEFGHMEVVNLLSSPTYGEKLVGYLAASVLLTNEDTKHIEMVLSSVRNDLKHSDDRIVSLALSCVANIGGPALTKTLVPDVGRLLRSRATPPVVRKKACLTMLRIARVDAETVPAGEWAGIVIAMLDEERDIGVLLAVATLALGLIDLDEGGSVTEKRWGAIIPHAVRRLTRLTVEKVIRRDYVYHGTPVPWLQVALIRILRHFPKPSDPMIKSLLQDALTKILQDTRVMGSVNRNNAAHSVLFEAIRLIIDHWSDVKPLIELCMKHLSRFISIREPNIRYLGLEVMSKIAAIPGTGEQIRKQQTTILVSLKDADLSIRRRALDLLFALCDKSNAVAVVAELVQHLVVAEYDLKSEMVLKIAILAERYAPDLRWYVRTVLRLVSLAGDHVTDDVWHRVVQIVTNNPDLQRYAARAVCKSLLLPGVRPSAVKLGGYILGEFGLLLTKPSPEGAADDDDDVKTESKTEGGPTVIPDVFGGRLQFDLLHKHFGGSTPGVKALLLSAYVKMMNMYPDLAPDIIPIFKAHTTVLDAELQQRACEYLALPSLSSKLSSSVLATMPAFNKGRKSILEARLEESKRESKDTDRWAHESRGRSATAASAVSLKTDGDNSSTDSESGDEGSTSSGSESGGDEEPDLLGLSSTPAPAPAPAPSPAPGGVGGGGGGGGGGAAAGPITTIKIDPALAPKCREWLSKLATTTRGVLYEDAYIQIGCLREIAGSKGTVSLFIGNRSKNPLKHFKLRVPTQTHVRAVPVGEVPSEVPASKQIKLQFAVECVLPFSDAPQLLVSFMSDARTGHAYPLRFPAFPTHFSQPVSMDYGNFSGRWGTLQGSGRDAQFEVVSDTGTIERATEVLKALNFLTMSDNAGGVAGVSSLRTVSVSKAGAPVSVGCLVKVQLGLGTYDVSIRTQHNGATSAMAKVIKEQLA